MKQFVGTKVINASPMNRLDYNTLRGWLVPSDEHPMDEGYLVECIGCDKPNTESYDGYISWTPKAQFEASFKEISTLKQCEVKAYQELEVFPKGELIEKDRHQLTNRR